MLEPGRLLVEFETSSSFAIDWNGVSNCDVHRSADNVVWALRLTNREVAGSRKGVREVAAEKDLEAAGVGLPQSLNSRMISRIRNAESARHAKNPRSRYKSGMAEQRATRVLLTSALERRYSVLASVPLMLQYESVLTRPEHLTTAGGRR